MPLFDKKDKSRYATFTRRSVGMGVGMTAVFAVLAGRLYQLQIRDGEEYLVAAEDNRISERLLAPPRGRILDRFGVELANNKRNYRVLLVSEQATEGVSEAVDTLAKVIQISDAQKKRILHDVAQNKKFVPVPVAENLTWEEYSRVNLHLPYLPGIEPGVGQTRDYPFGDELVHILGYVAAVSPEDKDNDDDPLLDLPGYRIGKRGIEKQYDTVVRGQAGDSKVEVDAHGRVIRDLGHEAGTPGKDIWLTLDGELQQFAAQRLAGESAACIVLDVQTGDVLAQVSAPGYDPGLFNVGVTPDQWRTLTEDDHKPLLDKVLSGTYPPGSTFKPIVALAAIEAGIATPDYRVNCTGRFFFGGRPFNCWAWTTYHRGHGSLDIEGGIKNSCDVFFYETARRVGIDKIQETALKLGLGAPTGIELPGEHGGLIPSRDWKQKKYKVAWQQGDTLSAGIGQGYVTATPLQLALEAARIASGRAVSPRLVHMVGNQLQRRDAAAPLAFSDEGLARVRDGMNQVMNEPGGTAYAFRGKPDPGVEIAGKTGTAQVRAYSQAEHQTGITKNAALEWKLRDHGLFIGFAPVAAPRYACACIIEHGATQEHVQVLMARDILNFAMKRGTLDKPTAYPLHAAELAPKDQVR
jgi:penicillin-binding protein 2